VFLFAAPLVVLSVAGCADLLNYDDYALPPGSGSGAAGGATGETCAPGDAQRCYEGPEGTEGAGLCHEGYQVCNPKGTAWGPCLLQVTPREAACVCMPGTMMACYDGSATKAGIGRCAAGATTCDVNGIWGACEGSVPPAPEKCSTPDIDEDCDGSAACNGAFRWAKRYADVAAQVSKAIAVDAVGNIIVVGRVTGTVDFGGGAIPPAMDSDGKDVDAFVLKLDPKGKLLWAQRFGDKTIQEVNGVGVDAAGNIVVAGNLQGTVNVGGMVLSPAPDSIAPDHDVFALKLDPDGKLLWVQRFGDAKNQFANAVAVDGGGDVVVTGSFQGKLDFRGEPATTLLQNAAAFDDVFVAKLSAKDGTGLWAKGFGGADMTLQSGTGVAIDPKTGAPVVAGVFPSSITFDGMLTSAGVNDIFVVKLGAKDGAPQWSKGIGGMGQDTGPSVAVDAAGNVFIEGTNGGALTIGGKAIPYGGANDIFVAKLDPLGKTFLVSAGFGDALAQTGQGITVDTDGNVIVLASIAGTVNFGGGPLTSAGANDAAVAKFDPQLKHLWSKRFGDPGGDLFSNAAVDQEGNVLLTGVSAGVVDYGGGPLLPVPQGANDITVVKLAP
jgi:hypothetical protein